MLSPSIFVAENYIFKNKSFYGNFPIYLRDACQVVSTTMPGSDLDEEKILIAAENNAVNKPRIINIEGVRQGILYTF